MRGKVEHMNIIQTYFQQFDRIAIALSGGMNSAYLLREAVATLGANHVLALTVNGTCMTRTQLELVKKIAALAGVEHIVITQETLDYEELQENNQHRCTVCKNRILQAIQEEAWVRGCVQVATGETCVAATEREGVCSPYIELNMDEAAYRELRGGEDIPHIGCALENIPHGMPITYELLEQLKQ